MDKKLLYPWERWLKPIMYLLHPFVSTMKWGRSNLYIYRDTNYRYYDVNQTSRLDLIRYLRKMGMSIKGIAMLLDKEDVDLIEKKLVERSIQIRNEIRALRETQDAVESTIKSIERYRKTPVP